MTVRIAPDGEISFIYRDSLRAFLALGEAIIQRASHVEPTESGLWQADLSPIGGPKLAPTETREDSLRAEAAWIDQNILGAAISEETESQ